MSAIAGVLVLAALQGPAPFAVVSEGDTTLVSAEAVIEVVHGSEAVLLPVPFDADGARIPVESAWWHVYQNEVYHISEDGLVETYQPGEHDVMFHWRDQAGQSARMVWVVIRVASGEQR